MDELPDFSITWIFDDQSYLSRSMSVAYNIDNSTPGATSSRPRSGIVSNL